MKEKHPTDALERYEQEAEQFYRDTGLMAPGKDSPAALGGSDDFQKRLETWTAWKAKRQGKVLLEHPEVFEHNKNIIGRFVPLSQVIEIVRLTPDAPGTHTGHRQAWLRKAIIARLTGEPDPEWNEPELPQQKKKRRKK